MQRLLHPRTIAVVGANDRPGSYSGETLLNLARLGYPGTVWGVNPGREEAHGVPCFSSLSELPEPPDAVVVAIPAAGVAAVVDEAGTIGCGGAVVYGAGFGEVAQGTALERELAETARRHDLPLCGPNGNGIVAVHERVALWGDALRPLEAGRVALVSQSGNVAVNALNTRRGLRLHTVISCGNSAALDPAEWIAQLAREEGVGSIAVYLEADGDGARLALALAECAERGVGVSVLKVGASPAGALAAAAHTGAVAGDQRVFRALVEEAGAAWAEDVHDLLELAKAQAVPAARPRSPGKGGLAVLTCSGGDSALAADHCARNGQDLPAFAPATAGRLRELLPDAATVGNPLDYTALIWGEVDTLRDIVVTVANDPSIEQIVVLYDQPDGIEGAAGESWADVREGIHAGSAASPVPVMVTSTLPELLDDAAAGRFADAGIAAIAGLRTGLACAAALRQPAGDPARLRAIATAAAAHGSNGSDPLSEHETKELLRTAGVPVVEGRLAAGEDEAAGAMEDLGPTLVLKLSSPALMHKSELRALALDLRSPEDVRAAYRRLVALGVDSAAVLVERMEPPGLELIVSARRDAVVPALVVGLGGVWTEIHDDAAVVPLPATPERVEAALLSLRGAGILTGARGGTPLDLAAAARLAAGVGDLLLAEDLALIELNPVLVHEHGALAVDAFALEIARA